MGKTVPLCFRTRTHDLPPKERVGGKDRRARLERRDEATSLLSLTLERALRVDAFLKNKRAPVKEEETLSISHVLSF